MIDEDGVLKSALSIRPFGTSNTPDDLAVVKCGKCIECLAERSTEWSFRIMIEAANHKQSCFVTLTYAKSPGSVSKRDFQLFMKKLRDRIAPIKVRYFACGEYGSKGRPHYHAVIFGWRPSDLTYFYTSGKDPLYLSHELERIWNLGFVTVGDLSLSSAKYVAKYLQKLRPPPEGCDPPFILMSNRPGIGYAGIDPSDVLTDKVYVQGRSHPLPRYFLKVLDRQCIDLADLKAQRLKNSKLFRRSDERTLQARERFADLIKKGGKHDS